MAYMVSRGVCPSQAKAWVLVLPVDACFSSDSGLVIGSVTSAFWWVHEKLLICRLSSLFLVVSVGVMLSNAMSPSGTNFGVTFFFWFLYCSGGADLGPALAASTASVLLVQLAIRVLQSWVSKPRSFGLCLWTGRWVLFCFLFFFIFGSTFVENCGYQWLHGDFPWR